MILPVYLRSAIVLAIAIVCFQKGTAQTTAYSLIVGLKEIDDSTYLTKFRKAYDKDGISGVDRDCYSIERLLKSNAHKIAVLRDNNATRKNIISAITEIGRKVKDGDTFLFYFSGHGDTTRDISGDELSGYDQQLVAYDTYILDDDIDLLLRKYFHKTENIMIVDACHSGTSYKIVNLFMDFPINKGKKMAFASEKTALSQNLSLDNCQFTTEKTIEPYNLIYFGATPDDKTAQGDGLGGLLTRFLIKCINDAKYYGTWKSFTYRKLACEVEKKIKAYGQVLQYHEIGNAVENYVNRVPFKL